MAATVVIASWHGTSAGKTSSNTTDGQAVRFKQADNDTVDLNNKIPIPPSGTSYSYPKNFQFNCTVAPSNLIDNLSVYSDGASGMGTGVDILVANNAAYLDPTVVGNQTAAISGGTSIFTKTQGSPQAITGTTSTTGLFGNFITMQMTVLSTASPGTTPAETITFSYDES